MGPPDTIDGPGERRLNRQPNFRTDIEGGLMVRQSRQSRRIVPGGDRGHGIAGWMACNHPEALPGLHINMVNLHTEGVTPATAGKRNFIAGRDFAPTVSGAQP